MKANYEIVLSALQASPGERTITLNGLLIGWYNNRLNYIMYTDTEEIWFIYDITLNAFIADCEKMSAEDITVIAANTALTKTRRYRS